MKMLFVIVALAFVTAQPALANQEGAEDYGRGGHQGHHGGDRGAAVVGGIIGGVIGGIIAGQDHGDRYPGRPGVVCFARNWRGETFRAFGRHPRFVQEQALDQCYMYSRNCRPLGCQWR